MDKQGKLSKISAYAVFVLSGFLFVFFCLTGRDLASRGNIFWTGSYTLRTMGISLVAGGILGAALCFFLCKAGSGDFFSTDALRKKFSGRWLFQRVSGVKSRVVFIVSMVLILLSWLPGYLAYYPAVCAYDFPIQMEQITQNLFNDHHPVMHTLLIKWSMDLGNVLFGSANAGIGCFAFVQMLFLASVFAVGTTYLWRRRERRIWVLLLQLFWMVYPFNFFMSISMTKDTIFSGFFMLQILALYGMVQGETDKKISAMEILFFFSSVGMILFRNNGKYAFMVLLAFLLLTVLFGKGKRRFFGRLLLLSVGAFIAGNIFLTVLFHAVGAGQGDKREMLSIPIQQMTRTMVYHGGVGVNAEDDGSMDDESKALINDFILNEAYCRYRPDFADPVKSNTNTYVVRYRTKEFITVYFRLLKQYPGDFINAVLAVDAGYLYPGDVTHAYINAQEGQAAGGGYVQTRWDEETLRRSGIYKASKWPGLHELLERWADDNAYLKLPILKYLFVPGTWLYLYLLLFGWLVVRKDFRLCLPLSLVLGYYLTLFLGPTVQLRYIYPVMIVYPFLALLCAGKRRDDAALQ